MQQSVRIGCLSLLTLAGLSHTAQAMDNYPTARLRMLDKVTARTSTFDVRIDTTVRFGPLYIRPRACRKASALEAPESASFLQVWEVTPKQDAQWIFSGWMFSSSPALSSMDSPIYDVWVLDCIGDALGGEDAAGQVGFSSGQIGYTSSQVGFASGGNTSRTQVSFMSGGQISYASGQIRFASTGDHTTKGQLDGQVGATSAVNFNSSGLQAPVTTPPAENTEPTTTPAPSPEDDDQTGTPARDNRDSGTVAPEQSPRQPSPGDEAAPDSIQEPVY